MTMRHFTWSAVLVVIGVAYVAGHWPERARRVALEFENTSLRTQLEDAETRVRVARVLGELMYVSEAVAARNYGQAQTLSSGFFDRALNEAGRTTDTDFRTTLDGILQNRDAVTGALARGDQAALATLHQSQRRLREALGYPVATPEPPAAMTPTTDPPTATAPPH